MSRPQRPLNYDCIYFPFPTYFFGALFIPKVPLETGAPPPPLNFFMLPTPLLTTIATHTSYGINQMIRIKQVRKKSRNCVNIYFHLSQWIQPS